MFLHSPRLATLAAIAAALPASAAVYIGPGGPIPDAPDLKGPPGEIVSDVEVTESIAIQAISVTLEGLTHTWCGDVIVQLTHLSSGTTQALVVRIGVPINPPPNSFGDSSNYSGDYTFVDGASDIWATAALGGTTFDIPSGAYRASGSGSGLAIPLSGAFAGVNALGTWRLTVQDAAAGDTGQFLSWSLSLTGSEFRDCPAAGGCFEAHPTPGCADAACCDAVCALAPDCCDAAWDQGCVLQAFATCGGCGDPGAGNCCTPHSGTGCADEICCVAICAIDLACCTVAWDLDCAILAVDVAACGCPATCGESSGCCFTTHDAAGCKDEACCHLTCEIDPACCILHWDATCATQAMSACCPFDLSGDGIVDGADLGLLLGVIYIPIAEAHPADFDCSGVVDSADLGSLLAAWGGC